MRIVAKGTHEWLNLMVSAAYGTARETALDGILNVVPCRRRDGHRALPREVTKMKNRQLVPIIVVVVALVLSGGIVFSSTIGTDVTSNQRDWRKGSSSTDEVFSWTKIMENTWTRDPAPTVLLAKRFRRGGFHRGGGKRFFVRHPRRFFWSYGFLGAPIYGYSYPYYDDYYDDFPPEPVKIYGDYGGWQYCYAGRCQ